MIASTINRKDILDNILFNIDSFSASSSISSRPYSPSKLLHILQNKELLNHADDIVIDLVDKLSGQYNWPTTLVIKGEFDKATQAISEIDTRAEEQLPPILCLYAKQWGLSVKALSYYKRKMFEPACAITTECIAINDYLIRIGFSTLLYRRLEQEINLSKIYTKQENWRSGYLLFGSIIYYLENGKSEGLSSDIFGDSSLWGKTPYLREINLLDFVCRATASLIAFTAQKPEQEKVIFGDLFARINQLKTNTLERLVLSDWLHLKQKYFSEQNEEFVSGLIEFMQEDLSKEFDILKLSLFQNLFRLIDKPKSECSDVVITNLRRFIDNKLTIDHPYNLLAFSS